MAAKTKRYCIPSGPQHMQRGIVYSFCESCGGAIGIGQRRICRKRRPQPRRQRQIVLYEVRR